MEAVILNSGKGSRMGNITSMQPKCLTKISDKETILSRQLNMLCELGIKDIVITTGYLKQKIIDYCETLKLPLNIKYVNNNDYESTNYIYSLYCARDIIKDKDIILMHGDLVFEYSVLEDMILRDKSCMKISTTSKLPDKDFKAVVEGGIVKKVGINYFDKAYEAQPLYKLNKTDWNIWLKRICEYCVNGKITCYAENALNDITDLCQIESYDAKNKLCAEVDTEEDLSIIKEQLYEINNRLVYMCFSTDVIHSGHIAIIKRAQQLGKVMVCVLSDEAIASYKRFPLLPFSERKVMFENIKGVYKVVEQNTLSYKNNIEKYRPDIVVHGDDWRNGIQKGIRKEVINILKEYGGELREFPYSYDKKYIATERKLTAELAMPDMRRSRLRKLLNLKRMVTALEAHSGLTGLIVEKTMVEDEGGIRQFDAIWISSLCDSTAKGKPDIELVDMTSRFRTIDDICEVTTKPIIFDGDTGGLVEHFIYTVRSLERMGVSMIIIEDKKGLKKNSLFGNDVVQTQASIEEFSQKIRAGKKAQRTKEFMICARIESLILEKGIDDALIRANAFVSAGADAIMIHSRKKEPDEIFEFVDKFRSENTYTPIVVVPTTFNQVTEEEFKNRGVNIVIYANQLTRTGFPAMENAAKIILKTHRAKECDELCMPFKDIITLIPEEL